MNEYFLKIKYAEVQSNANRIERYVTIYSSVCIISFLGARYFLTQIKLEKNHPKSMCLRKIETKKRKMSMFNNIVSVVYPLGQNINDANKLHANKSLFHMRINTRLHGTHYTLYRCPLAGIIKSKNSFFPLLA